MEQEIFDIDNTYVQVLMVVHLQELNRTGQASLSYSDLEDYLAERVWRRGAPLSLHQAADDILKIRVEDIVRFLAGKAATASGSLADLADMLGGTEE